jgi:hypothetical protein
LVFSLASGGTLSQITLSPVPDTSLQVGFNTCSVIEDINGDDLEDLIVVNRVSDSTIMIFLQDEDDPFDSNSFPDLTIISGSFTESIAVGDLNGDGLKDLAVTHASAGDSGAIMFFQLNTTELSFTNSDLYTGNKPRDIAIGDLNNDGLDDIAVANGGSQNLYIYYNDKNSTPTSKDVTLLVNDNPRGVEIGDLNNDGLNDIVVTQYGSPEIFVYYQNDGGGFNTNPDRRLLTGEGESINYFMIAINDLNNDGLNDLVIINHVFYQEENNELPDRPDITVSEYGKPCVGDVNSDGFSDLIITGPESVYLFYQKSDRTISQTPNLTIVLEDSRYSSVGDLNNDGMNELAISNTKFYEILIDYQGEDSDLDSYPDYIDVFPEDPLEWFDSDEDGVGDNADFYPNDQTRWEEETTDESFFMIVLLVVIILIVIILLVLMQNSGKEQPVLKDALPKESQDYPPPPDFDQKEYE